MLLRTKTRLILITFSIPAAIFGTLLIAKQSIVTNWTNSEPKGFYKKNAPNDIKLNDYVIIPNSINEVTKLAVTRNYLPVNHNFIKNIFGVPGDIIKINNNIISINDKILGIILTNDAYDKPLPTIIKEGVIPPDHYFVASTRIHNSFDSRYFGLVSKKQIISKATPLLTF